MSPFWSGFVIILTLANIIACLWLLLWTAKRDPNEAEKTGHVWDEDLEELNNPLPRWWLILFVLTVIFSLGYLVMYPGLGNYAGELGWSQASQFDEESADLEARQAEAFGKFDGLSIEEISANTEAFETGRRIFANNCATCHGSDGRGAPGFPNLADNDWLYGGDGETIFTSITQGRSGIMPPWSSALDEQQIAEVSAFVFALNGRTTNTEIQSLAVEGEKTYQLYCAACHMPSGVGNPIMGAANLADDIWLFGGSFEKIVHTVTFGRTGRMPMHKELLSEQKRRLVAAYVYGLSKRESTQQ